MRESQEKRSGKKQANSMVLLRMVLPRKTMVLPKIIGGKTCFFLKTLASYPGKTMILPRFFLGVFKNRRRNSRAPTEAEASLERQASDVAWGFAWNVGGVSRCGTCGGLSRWGCEPPKEK